MVKNNYRPRRLSRGFLFLSSPSRPGPESDLEHYLVTTYKHLLSEYPVTTTEVIAAVVHRLHCSGRGIVQVRHPRKHQVLALL